VLLLRYPTSRGLDGAQPAVVAASDNEVGAVSGPAVPSSSGGASSRSDATTVNGRVVATRWGPVQVQVAIAAGRITDVVALQYPEGNSRDRQINARALPMLHDRVLAAQSADVDVVTGATVTSDGYLASLQAALETAHFG
jgi:hypothetical protein